MKTRTEPLTLALTGASGFIGGHVVRALLADGFRLRCLVRPGQESALAHHRDLLPIPGTLEDPAALEPLVRQCAGVIHLAGATGGRSYSEFAAVNVSGTGRLLEITRKHAPNAHFIHVSSLAAREPGLSWYSKSKRAGEDLVRSDRESWSILRPPAVYGPGDRELAPLWRSLARGWLLQIGPANQRFSLAHSEDVAQALCRLARLERGARRILEIQDSHHGGYDWPELAGLASKARQGKVRRLRLPAGMLRPLAWYNLKLSRQSRPVLVPGKLRELAHADWVCDNTALEETLGWQPDQDFPDRLGSLPGWDRYRQGHPPDSGSA